MKIYLVTSILNVHAGMLLLNNDQARRRNHVLVKQTDKVNSLGLSDEEKEFIDLGGDKSLAVYKLIGSTQFKVGEKIGCDGELNKVLTSMLTPVADIEKAADEEVDEEVDELLINAIIELDPENDAHWTTQGKPEIEILKGLLKRKVTGKERDASFNAFQNQQAKLIEVISMFEPESSDWTEDNKPKAEVVSGFVDREVSQKECDLAHDVLLASRDRGND